MLHHCISADQGTIPGFWRPFLAPRRSGVETSPNADGAGIRGPPVSARDHRTRALPGAPTGEERERVAKGKHAKGTSTSTRTIGVGASAAGLAVIAGLGIVVLGGGTDPAEPATTTSPPTTAATTTVVTEPPAPLPTWPLTGLEVVGGDAAHLDQPALVVKIDNADQGARPQIGINEADVVYEERVEGGVTRFLTVFHSHDSQPIGPVRSGRSTDIPIFSALNRPMFAWSGSNEFMAAEIRDSNMVDVGHTPAVDQYYRDGSRRAPHNLFINGYQAMVDTHRDDAGPPPALFAFRATSTTQVGDPVTHVDLSFGGSGAVPVTYDWDGSGWARGQNGRPHVDGAGVQVSPPNVVVQFVEYVGYSRGPHIPVGQTVGEGEVWVLTDGMRIVGRWVKPTPDAVTQYLLPDGSPIELTPGRTWVALVPPGGATAT
jgi:Protein of unknown function (DUF3048) N-terminal domain/Protein of unknown function (DUF3048) C-terminal domain